MPDASIVTNTTCLTEHCRSIAFFSFRYPPLFHCRISSMVDDDQFTPDKQLYLGNFKPSETVFKWMRTKIKRGQKQSYNLIWSLLALMLWKLEIKTCNFVLSKSCLMALLKACGGGLGAMVLLCQRYCQTPRKYTRMMSVTAFYSYFPCWQNQNLQRG